MYSQTRVTIRPCASSHQYFCGARCGSSPRSSRSQREGEGGQADREQRDRDAQPPVPADAELAVARDGREHEVDDREEHVTDDHHRHDPAEPAVTLIRPNRYARNMPVKVATWR